MTKVNTKKRKKQYHIFNNFRGLVETLPEGELPYVYFVTMINCRLDDDDNIRQRPGTGYNSNASLYQVTKAGIFNLENPNPTELFPGFANNTSNTDQRVLTPTVVAGVMTIDYTSGLDEVGLQLLTEYEFTAEVGHVYEFTGTATVQAGSDYTTASVQIRYGLLDSEYLDIAGGSPVSTTFRALTTDCKLWVVGPFESTKRFHFDYENFSIKDTNTNKEVALFCSGDDLKEILASDLKTGSLTTKGTGLNWKECDMVQLNNTVFIFNGEKYHSYDGDTNMAEVDPKIPEISIGRTPAGVGTDFEEPNALTDEFTDSFNGDGATTTYVGSHVGLESDTVICTIDGTPVVEGVGFTVNRTAGTYDFSAGSAPHGAPASGTDNVKITAVKDGIGDATLIQKCRFATLFSGASDSRIFCSGNPEYSNYVFWSDLNDGTYFPINNSQQLGDDYPVQGFVKQYKKLAIVKEQGIFTKTFEDDPVLGPVFVPEKVNSKKGTKTVDQVILIENNPYFLNGDGLYELIKLDQLDERNVELRSFDVNNSLKGAEKALAKLFDNQLENELYIAIGEEIWVYNYLKKAWYTWHGIYMNAGFEYDGEFYFVNGDESSYLCWLDDDLMNDYDGDAILETAIDAFLEMAFWDFGYPNYYKTLDYFIMTADTDVGVRCDVTLLSERGIDEAIEINPIFATIDFGNIDFGNFTFETMYAPNPSVEKVDFRDFISLKIRFRNNYSNSKLSLNSLKLDYRVTKLVR